MGWSGSSPKERGSERMDKSRALVAAPGERASGAFPGLGQCTGPLSRPPKGVSPHASETPPELRVKPAARERLPVPA